MFSPETPDSISKDRTTATCAIHVPTIYLPDRYGTELLDKSIRQHLQSQRSSAKSKKMSSAVIPRRKPISKRFWQCVLLSLFSGIGVTVGLPFCINNRYYPSLLFFIHFRGAFPPFHSLVPSRYKLHIHRAFAASLSFPHSH